MDWAYLSTKFDGCDTRKDYWIRVLTLILSTFPSPVGAERWDQITTDLLIRMGLPTDT